MSGSGTGPRSSFRTRPGAPPERHRRISGCDQGELGGDLLTEPLLRRSLHLRAALGARPQTVAAQAALADYLPNDDPERADLVQTFRAGAQELRIGWLLAGG